MTTKLTRPEIVFNKNRLNPLAKSLYENFGRDKRGRRRGAWGKHALPSYNRADFIDEKACGTNLRAPSGKDSLTVIQMI